MPPARAVGDISLKEGEATNGFLAWRTASGSPYTPTPVVYGEHLYTVADNGVVAAYDARTGQRIYQDRLPSSFSASPVAADGKIYASSEDGEVYVIRTGPKFELLSTNPMGAALMATPAITNGLLIIRTQTHLYAVAGKKKAGS